MILVNQKDEIIGYCDKLTTHKYGLLHRAFSVVLYSFHKKEKIFLLQQRSMNKYHGMGLWSNSCCSHFSPGIDNNISVNNRLIFELGLTANVCYLGKFHYKANLGDMIEHEIDYVFYGEVPYTKPKFNTQEIMDICWISEKDLLETNLSSTKFTPWLKQVFSIVL